AAHYRNCEFSEPGKLAKNVANPDLAGELRTVGHFRMSTRRSEADGAAISRLMPALLPPLLPLLPSFPSFPPPGPPPAPWPLPLSRPSDRLSLKFAPLVPALAPALALSAIAPPSEPWHWRQVSCRACQVLWRMPSP